MQRARTTIAFSALEKQFLQMACKPGVPFIRNIRAVAIEAAEKVLGQRFGEWQERQQSKGSKPKAGSKVRPILRIEQGLAPPDLRFRGPKAKR